MSSQFSEVRFSSVALATRTVNTRHNQALFNLLTDGVVEDVLLGPEHGRYDDGFDGLWTARRDQGIELVSKHQDKRLVMWVVVVQECRTLGDWRLGRPL